MDLKKRNVAITAGLTAVLALSPVVAPVATAFAEGSEAAPQEQEKGTLASFVVYNPATGEYVQSIPVTSAGQTSSVKLDKIPDAPSFKDYDFAGWEWDGAIYSAAQLQGEVVPDGTEFTAVYTKAVTPDPEPDPTPEYESTTIYFVCGDETYTITLTEDANHPMEYCFDEFVDTLEKWFPEVANTEWVDAEGNTVDQWLVVEGGTEMTVKAKVETPASIYTVEFYNGEELVGSVTKGGEHTLDEYIADLPTLKALEKDGYELKWVMGPDQDVIAGTDTILTNLKLTAQWTAIEEPVANTYKVTFDDCLDSTENAVVEVNEGEAVAKPADPTCEGYTFLGWFADTDLTVEWNFDDPVTSDMTLWAKWEKNADVTPEEPGDVETPTTPADDQQTTPAGDQQADPAEDAAVPETGDATLAASGIAALGSALAGLGALVRRRRA